jgi:hypothetical protein
MSEAHLFDSGEEHSPMHEDTIEHEFVNDDELTCVANSSLGLQLT